MPICGLVKKKLLLPSWDSRGGGVTPYLTPAKKGDLAERLHEGSGSMQPFTALPDPLPGGHHRCFCQVVSLTPESV